jgi:hypothetical protein
MTASVLLRLSLLLQLLLAASAWSTSSSENLSRRSFCNSAAAVAVTAASATITLPAQAASPLIDELKDSKVKMEPIVQLLEDEEWEKVRAILKTPPVNKLWNLGDVSV